MPAIYPDFDARGAAAPALGVLVCEKNADPPFAEASFIRLLQQAGDRRGVEVFAFDPRTWNARERTVAAWKWNASERAWRRQSRPVPALGLDRAWPSGPAERMRLRRQIRRLLREGGLRQLNSRLPGKGAVYGRLAGDPAVSRYIPPFAAYEDAASLSRWLDRFGGAAFLKPDGGSQGRRVVAVRRCGAGRVQLSGRTATNRRYALPPADEGEALARLHRWIGGRPYWMQPLLDLTGPAGEPFDLRVLAQKDGSGRWHAAGIAARVGRPGSVTANLHGGGTAVPADRWLGALYGEQQASRILQEVRSASAAIVRRLENAFGHFAEIGLDFGVDRSAAVWFLEANGKPGRAAMACLGRSRAEAALERPLAYARSILFRPPGRVINEFDHL